MTRTVLLNASLVLAVMLACAVALLAAPMKPAEAAFPGKNGDIAFTGTPEDQGNWNVVYGMNPDGTAARRILGFVRGEYTQNPAWSPDGTRVAADAAGEGDWYTEIFLVNANGTDPVNLTNSPDVSESEPAFFPSGQRTVFCSNGGLASMAFDEAGNAVGPRRQLTNEREGPYYSGDCGPSVSPDGKKIAFVRNLPGGSYWNNDIYVMRTGTPEGPGNRPKMLTDSTTNEESPLWTRSADNPDWSPDSQRIVYDRGGTDIWIMNSDGSGKKNLGPGRYPSFSPDGEMITFSFSSQIWTMRVDGTERSQLSPDMPDQRSGEWYLREPTWQPLLPTRKSECANSGYKEFGFESQGDCVASVKRGS